MRRVGTSKKKKASLIVSYQISRPHVYGERVVAGLELALSDEPLALRLEAVALHVPVRREEDAAAADLAACADRRLQWVVAAGSEGSAVHPAIHEHPQRDQGRGLLLALGLTARHSVGAAGSLGEHRAVAM